LGLGSTFLGMALLFWGDIEGWLEPVVGYESEPAPLPTSAYIGITLAFVIAGSIIGWITYARREVPIEAPQGNWLTRAARKDLYGDAVNYALVVAPTNYAARALVWFDSRIVDGCVNGSAAIVGGLSGRMRRTQSGFIRSYALSMVGGAVLVLLALVLVRI
jgi:NADH-quinone oxidoreductase subunit L